jgi:hypothetical protein
VDFDLEWRRRYKALPPVRQMMVTTIISLYRGEADKTWLARLPSAWHAADAIAALLEAGAGATPVVAAVRNRARKRV